MKDVFDHSRSDAAWKKFSKMDPFNDPGYEPALEEYLRINHEENQGALEKLRELEAKAARALCHCGKPEVDHIWISESELNEWRPQEGFKKNSCARKPSSSHTEDAPDLVFKVWSPPDNPCDEEYMEEISS